MKKEAVKKQPRKKEVICDEQVTSFCGVSKVVSGLSFLGSGFRVQLSGLVLGYNFRVWF